MRTLSLALTLLLVLAMGAFAQEAPAAEDDGLRITVAHDVETPQGADVWSDFDQLVTSLTVDLALSPQLYASYGISHDWLAEINAHDVSATLDWGDGLTTRIGVRRAGDEIAYYGRAQIVFGSL